MEEIREYALAITAFLVEQGAKAVVMACNMSSATALAAAQEIYPNIPILGVILPGARAAVRQASGRPIGVLATTGTVRSRAYTAAIKALDPNATVIEQACPKFVPLVEAGKSDTEEAEAAARQYTLGLVQAGVSTVVLGCTHYPFLRRAISAALGPSVTIVDPAEETVEELAALVRERGLEAEDANPGSLHRFFTSGDSEGFVEIGSRFLGRPIVSVERAVWGVDVGKVLA